MLEELFDTPIGKIVGGISAFAGAVYANAIVLLGWKPRIEQHRNSASRGRLQ